MTSPEQRPIDMNYDALQRMLGMIIAAHRDKHALMRDCQIVGYFAHVGDAYRAGLARYPDRIFSIQEVTDQPIDPGIYGHFLS